MGLDVSVLADVNGSFVYFVMLVIRPATHTAPPALNPHQQNETHTYCSADVVRQSATRLLVLLDNCNQCAQGHL